MDKNVIILLTNPLEIDNRVCNEAHALIDAGFNVIVYAWDMERRYSNKIDDVFDGIKIRRILMKSAYGQGPKQLYSFICFWTIILFRLMLSNFDIVHCVDLNTLAPGFIAAKIKGKKIVYDSHENFPAAMLDSKIKNLSFFAEKVESFIIKRVDLVITVSEPIAQVLRSRGAKKLHVVPTTKPLSEYGYPQEHLVELRGKLVLENKFIFLYMGLLYQHRNVLEIIEIFRNYVSGNNVFLIGGYGTLEEDVKKVAGT